MTHGPPVTPGAPWPLGSPPADYELGHVRAVLPDRVLDDARVVVRGGAVVEVSAHPAGRSATVDGRGAVCLAGIVDVHSDALVRTCRPRPGATVPTGFALSTVRGAARASGILTTFHGVPFAELTAVGLPPTTDDAAGIAAEVTAAGDPVLHRVDVRSESGVARLGRWLEEHPTHVAPLVSHEDHTPGQGQYADPGVMERWMVAGEGMTPDEAHDHVRSWRASREAQAHVRDASLAWLGELARAGRIRLMGHDPTGRADIEALVARGGTVAEFPTTVEAAEAARAAGLLVVAGAPNVVRGGSHAGNVSAGELVARGLVDAVASDYLPGAMVAAVAVLVRGGAPLHRAVRLVTSGPAAVAGPADRGSLEPGRRADLVLVDVAPEWPVVTATLRAG